ncbi:MAG TPA: methyltransferase [Clostridiales bacterium]|nr:methyltransferase [Clostridiales bacterium]
MRFVILQLIFFLRMFLACICGAVIGYERKNRGKGAGIRTHTIVSLAAALMMIVSKYGFADLLDFPGVRGADPSRIAAQVVSGVGFLGAGMIYFNRHLVKGLTTAAGIWATAGVGLAMGAGLYYVGIFATVVVVFCQIFLHKNYKFLHMPSEEILSVTLEDSEEAMDFLNNMLAEYNIVIGGMKCRKKESGLIEVEMDISTDTDIAYGDLLKTFKDAPYIHSFSI